MKNFSRGLRLLALGLGLALWAGSPGCHCCPDEDPTNAADDPQPVVSEPDAESVCLPECRQAPPCQELCSPTRRVSVGAGGCVPPEGWAAVPLLRKRLEEVPKKARAELLLGDLTVDPDAFASVAERAGLGDVCIYEWRGERAPTSFPPDSVPDCQVVPTAPGGLTTGNAEGEILQGLAEGQSAELGSIPRMQPRTPVMVAVVDTAPASPSASTSPAPTGALHGQAMASIVRDVACDSDSRCSKHVRTFLGLPRVWGEPKPNPSGGYYGYQSDLARGILEAVAAFEVWKEEGRSDGRLVINLSVGWEPACDTRGSTLVRRALAHATERGALVLAAAGNRPLGSCVTGPTAPGAWGTESVAIEAITVPLLHAVTPVDDRLAELATFRPGSNTRIAAPGYMRVTTDETFTPTRVLGPYTGSSVATAVTSGIAALVWSRHPELTAQEVMAVLWEGGRARKQGSPSVAVQADSYYGSLSPEQHVVSACRALERAACWGSSAACPPSTCTDETNDFNQRLDEVWSFIAPSVVPERVTLGGTTVTVECPGCAGPTRTVVAGSSLAPAQADPWVVPQPSDPPCPVCKLKVKSASAGASATGLASLLRASVYNTYTLMSTTITLKNSAGTLEQHQYPPSILRLDPDKIYVLDDPDFEDVGNAPTVRAEVAMTFANGSGPGTFTVSNEIAVIRE